MPELTKEHFDQQLKGLVTQTDLKAAFETAFDKQAVLINNAFQTHSDHFDEQINAVRTDIQRVETKVDKALHTEYVNLEVRVKRLEQKIGITSPAS